MVEINSSQDVKKCMNAMAPRCWCESHAEVMTATAGKRKEKSGDKGRRSRYRIQNGVRGQAARGVCSKQFQLTRWNWNRTRRRRPGRRSTRGCHGVEDDEDMSIPSPSSRLVAAHPHFSSSNFAVMLYRVSVTSADGPRGCVEHVEVDEKAPYRLSAFTVIIDF